MRDFPRSFVALHVVAAALAGQAAMSSMAAANGPDQLVGKPKISSCGSYVVAITEDGRVIGWGNNGKVAVPEGIVNPVEVSCWAGHAMVLQADGSVVAWGGNSYGQSDVPADLPPVRAIAGLSEGSIVTLLDGTMAGWGRNYYCGIGSGTLDFPEGLDDVTELSGGNAHWLYRRQDGTIAGSGCNFSGQLNIPSGFQDPIDFNANESWSCVLSSSGQLAAFGYGGFGRLEVPAGSDFIDADCGNYFGIALRSDGSVVGWGDNGQGQLNVPEDMPEAVAVAAGGSLSIAIHGDGSLTLWGSNGAGEADWPTEERIRLGDPDCNGNGVADWLDILDGFEDLDENGVPDACERDIMVPADYATIQEAIDAAEDGDVILVSPGDYPEAIDFGTKNLVLQSTDGPEVTSIGRYGTKISIVTIGGGQSMDTELRGFTIQRGYRGTPVPGNPSSLVGGGVFVNEASPLIENCIFTDNKTAFGSGVYHFFGGGEVRDCLFLDNYATSDGGGALAFISDVEYVNCIFDDNFAIGEGAGIKVVLGTTSLTSCMFVLNESRGDGGAVFWFANDDSDPMEMVGCSITANLVASDARGAGVYARPGYAPVRITDSAICGNEPDEIYGPFVDVSGNLLCICPGDLNGDGEVGGADLGVMLALWGECLSDPCDPDLNGDGVIDGGDLGLLLVNWGQCFSP